MKHSSSSRFALSDTVRLNQAGNIIYNMQITNNDRTILMKSHGIVMVFAWILLISTGILFSRYCKSLWPNCKIRNKALWFVAHRAIMLIAAALTLIGFALILMYKDGKWVHRSRNREFIHSILGIFVISAAVIQPIMSIFRCKPNEKHRFIFNYAHAGLGLTGFLVSIAAIFLIMFSKQITFQLVNPWSILVAWLCWVVLLFIVFEFIERCLHEQPKEEKKDEHEWLDLNANTGEVDATHDSSSTKPLLTKDRIKKVLLVLHFLFALSISIALTIVIQQSS